MFAGYRFIVYICRNFYRMFLVFTLYFIGLVLYKTAATLISPFNPKAKKWVKGQWHLLKKIRKAINNQNGNQKILWVHCSSLGEFEQGRPVIEAFREKHPDYKILLTFFSPSGYEVRKNYNRVDWVFYLPLDLPFNAKRFIRTVNPTVAIFVKYEFWFSYLTGLKKNGTHTYLISAIFRSNQTFFRKCGGFSRKMLSCFDHLFVQNEHSVELLKSINITNVTRAGDTRFDRVYQLVSQAVDIPAIEKFKTGKPLLIAGSTWADDERMIAKYASHHTDMQMVIAPHEVNEPHIESIIKLFPNRKLIRFTRLKDDENLADYDILLIDTIGLLMSAYRYGDWAYIGGGFNKSGIHNTLEAATFGLPVVFGPNFGKFMEAKGLVNAESGFSISAQAQLDAIFDLLRTNEAFRKQAGEKSKAYVKQNLGATTTIADSIIVG